MLTHCQTAASDWLAGRGAARGGARGAPPRSGPRSSVPEPAPIPAQKSSLPTPAHPNTPESPLPCMVQRPVLREALSCRRTLPLGRALELRSLPKGRKAGQLLTKHLRCARGCSLRIKPPLNRVTAHKVTCLRSHRQRVVVGAHTQACGLPTEALSLSGPWAGPGQTPKGPRWGPQQLRLA